MKCSPESSLQSQHNLSLSFPKSLTLLDDEYYVLGEIRSFCKARNLFYLFFSSQP